MNVNIDFQDEILLCHLSGEIDHHTALPIRISIDERIENCRPKTVILDFTDVTFMDSSGIGLVMGRYKILQKKNAKLHLTNLPPNIYKVMKLSGIERLAKIEKEHENENS